MNDKKYVPKHLKDSAPVHYEKLDENPIDLKWLNQLIDECQKESSIYDKKGVT